MFSNMDGVQVPSLAGELGCVPTWVAAGSKTSMEIRMSSNLDDVQVSEPQWELDCFPT